MNRPCRSIALLITAGLLAIGGCSWWQWTLGGAAGVTAFSVSRFNHLYAGPHRGVGVEELPDGPPNVRLAFVEADDHGWFHERAQAQAVLDTLEALHARGNVAVVVYVHGWRHNASKNDKDVEAFEQTLRYLGDRLQRDDFRELRARRTGDPNTTIVGVYVGWRGKMAPEAPPPLGYVNLPVFASFWNRKATARVVGRGDVREFLLHLDDLYARVNRFGEEPADDPGPLMTLVVIGHSFGGHIVFDAVRDRIEGHLFTALDASQGSGETLGVRLYPDPVAEVPVAFDGLVRGVGDLIVLINPAMEAAAYRRIDEVVKAARFDRDQQPVLITVSAEDDAARNRQFATARGISLWGVRRTEAQSTLLGRALGSHGSQITHDLALRDPSEASRARARVKILDALRSEPAAARQADPLLLAAKDPVSVEQRARTFAPEDTSLVLLTERDERFRRAPAIVVRATRDVIRGHSDFFRVGFVSWLSEYVLEIQRANLRELPSRRQMAK